LDFYTWTRKKRAPFKHRAAIALSYLAGGTGRKVPGKNFGKLSLSYAILRGRLKLFRLTPP
jgi:hypothetical protein